MAASKWVRGHKAMRIDKLLSKRDLQQLRREAPTPLYYQMYTRLKKRILDGTIPRGIQLPTEQQLARAFSVSRITTRRAMNELAKEDLVDRQRGRGTYVTHHYAPPPEQAPLVGMLERLAGMSRETQVKVLDSAELTPPASIRNELGIGSNDKALRLVRVRYSDGQPFAYYVSWTPGDVRGFDREHLQRPGSSRLEILRQNGVQIARVEQFLGAASADAEVAGHLELLEDAPVLTLMRRSLDQRGKTVDILHCQYHPERFQYRMSLGLEEYRGRK